MLTFLIALRPKAAGVDWPHVSRLCEATLRSVCNQTHPAFRVIVACHDEPHLSGPLDPRVEFVRVSFPPPPPDSDRKARMRDKYLKLTAALVRAAAHKPTFTMIADADDLVSNRLAAIAAETPAANGWAFETGYWHTARSGWVVRTPGFHRLCGTSAIISTRLFKFPADESEGERSGCVLIKHGHQYIVDHMAKAGTPLAPLPFPGTVYVVHGANEIGGGLGWRKVLRSLHRLRPVTAGLRREFGLSV